MPEVKLKISFHGQNSDVVIGMYIDSQLMDDVTQVGWNLVNCDDSRFTQSIGECVVVGSGIVKGKANIDISLSGSDEKLIERTIKEYLDSFDYFIRPVMLELVSRTGEKYEFVLEGSNYLLIEAS